MAEETATQKQTRAARRANARATPVVVACLELVVTMMEETPLVIRATELLDELNRSMGRKSASEE